MQITQFCLVDKFHEEEVQCFVKDKLSTSRPHLCMTPGDVWTRGGGEEYHQLQLLLPKYSTYDVWREIQRKVFPGIVRPPPSTLLVCLFWGATDNDNNSPEEILNYSRNSFLNSRNISTATRGNISDSFAHSLVQLPSVGVATSPPPPPPPQQHKW